jgi:predicted XRE-type DNA-binding protein
MSRENLDQLVKWRPELSPDEQAYAEQLRAQTRPQLTFVRDFRKSLGLSQVDMAELLEMTQSNVSKNEKRNDIAVSSIVKVALSKRKRVRVIVENEAGDEEASFVIS